MVAAFTEVVVVVRKRHLLLVSPLLLLVSSAVCQHAAALDNGAGVTPALGWSSWNAFGNHVSEALILATADALVETGLSKLGFRCE